MKNLLWFIALVILTLNNYAQKVTAVFEDPDYPGVSNKYCRFAPLSLKSDNKGISLTLVKQYVKGPMERNTEVFFERGQTLINFLKIYKLDYPLQKHTIINDSCSRDTIIDRSQILHHTEYVKYKLPYKITRKYPFIVDLPPSNSAEIWETDRAYFYPWVYDTSLNRYCPNGNGRLLKSEPPPDGLKYNIFTGNVVEVWDNQHRNSTALWARKPKDSEDKQYYLKNLSVVTYSYNSSDLMTNSALYAQTKITNSFTYDFTYPRECAAGVPVYAKENSKDIVGKVFFFTRLPVFPKKLQDPVRNNFEIIYCSAKGDLIFHKIFNFGGEKRIELNLLYAYGTNNKLSLFVQYYTEERGLGIFTFTQDTSYQQILAPISAIRGKTVIAQNESDIQFFTKRDQVCGTFQGSKGVGMDGNDINLYTGHCSLPDGGVIIYGQRGCKKTTLQPNNGSMATAQSETESFFTEFFALHFNTDKQLAAQYISEITINKKPVNFDAYVANNKLYILTSMPKKPMSPGEITEQSLESQIFRNVKYDYPEQFSYIPKIICIDYSKLSINSYMPSGNFYVFSPKMFHSVLPDGSVYLVGYNVTQNNRTLRIEKVNF